MEGRENREKIGIPRVGHEKDPEFAKDFFNEIRAGIARVYFNWQKYFLVRQLQFKLRDYFHLCCLREHVYWLEGF